MTLAARAVLIRQELASGCVGRTRWRRAPIRDEPVQVPTGRGREIALLTSCLIRRFGVLTQRTENRNGDSDNRMSRQQSDRSRSLRV